MGLSHSLPSALALGIGEMERRLSLDRNVPAPEGAWARFEALELDVPRDAPPPHRNGHDSALEHLKTRRLALHAAILSTDRARLEACLRACVPDSSGFAGLRVWFKDRVPWIGGRVTIAEREAAFTVRLAIEPRATGARRLGLFLGDVRLYAPLPLPAPLVGSALARAIVAGCGRPSPRLAAQDGGLDVAPLDAALVSALVARGWRLPALASASLRTVATPDRSGDGPVRLIFGDDGDTELPALSPVGPGSWLEGTRLPDALAAAERALFAGDLRAAEEAYRAALASRPEDLAAQARLVALAAPAGTTVLEAGARALIQAWPDFLPGWLYAALGAWQAGERDTAAIWFTHAAALATARGEEEDARLAHQAAAAARSGPPAQPGATRVAAGPVPLAATIARALMAGDHASADAAIAGCLDQTEEPARRGDLYAEIAEAILAAGGGATLALATVAEVSLAGSSARGLELRAELGERLGNVTEAGRALGELLTRAVAAGETSRAAALSERQARLTSSPAALRPQSGAVQALAARAELAFRARDWAQARELYAKLDRAPDAADAIGREALVHRRAQLARAAGDDATAEACFRELAILDTRQIEARQALADIAAARGDLATAARRLEEVLRLLPLDALDATLAVRERLGDLHARLGDWSAVRYYQELILGQDAGRAAALERLIEALLHLGLSEDAAAACERLSRLYPEPARRAAALYRQGDILLEQVHDEPRAFDAFLKSSDLAPEFVPTALRLLTGYWARGRYDEVADVAGELARSGALARAPLALRLRAALAAALAGQETPVAVGVDDARTQPRELARAIAEAAQGLGAAPPSSLEPAIRVIIAPGGVEARTALAALTSALGASLNDEQTPLAGAAIALGWLADRRGDQAVARPLYALGTFLDGGAGVAERLQALGPCPAITTAALALAGGNDHPGVGGTSAPLRRALGALAHGLAGFGSLASAPGELEIASERREAWYALAKLMSAPPLRLAEAEGRPGPGDAPPEVTAQPTRPAIISIPPSLMILADDELTFWVARAFDRLRSGLALVDAITSGEPGEVEALLRGAAAALAGRTPPELPLAIAAAAELAGTDRVVALVSAAPRPRVAGDLLLAEEALAGWKNFRASAALAADRFALLACRNPLAALRALDRQHAAEGVSGEQARRTTFLRTPRLAELVAFMTSAAYADATRDARD